MFCSDTNCDALFLWRTVPKTGHGIHNFKRSTEIAPPASLTHFNLSPRCCHRRRELRLSLSSLPATMKSGRMEHSTTREFSSFFAWNARYAPIRKPAECTSSFYDVSRRLAASTAKKFQLQRGQLLGGLRHCLLVRSARSVLHGRNLIRIEVGWNCMIGGPFETCLKMKRIFTIHNQYRINLLSRFYYK